MHDRGRSALVHEVLFHRNSSCGTQAAHAAVRPRAVARGLAQPPRSGHEYSFPLRTRQNLHLLRRFGVLALFKLVARPSRMATRSSSHRPYRCTAFSSALPNREVPCTRHLSRACCQLWLPPLPVSTRVPKALASIAHLNRPYSKFRAQPVLILDSWFRLSRRFCHRNLYLSIYLYPAPARRWVVWPLASRVRYS